jgi:hypothetical protein
MHSVGRVLISITTFSRFQKGMISLIVVNVTPREPTAACRLIVFLVICQIIKRQTIPITAALTFLKTVKNVIQQILIGGRQTTGNMIFFLFQYIPASTMASGIAAQIVIKPLRIMHNLPA